MCNKIQVQNNLSLLFSPNGMSMFPSNLNIFNNDENKENVRHCSIESEFCCENSAFAVSKLVSKSMLHKLSGLYDIQDNIKTFNTNFKSFLLEIIDTLIYNFYLSLKQHGFVKDTKQVTMRFYKFFNIEKRRKLNEKFLKIDLKLIVSQALEAQNCFIKKLNSKKISKFIIKFNEDIEKIFLTIYRQTTKMEMLFMMIQDISLNEDCINELQNMLLCGVCSQNLDWTSYTIREAISSNVRICPKYCHNTVRKCVRYYLLLAKPLQSFQEIFLRFITEYYFNIAEFTRLWFEKNGTLMSIFRIIDDFKKNPKNKSTCENQSESSKKSDEDPILLDSEDIKHQTMFQNCIDRNDCSYIQDEQIFVNKSTKYFTDSKSLLKNINNLINPENFVNRVAENCDHLNFSRCWNGFEIGQYHKEILQFDLMDEGVEICKNISIAQMNDVIKLILYIRKSNIYMKNEINLNQPNYHQQKISEEDTNIEGSGDKPLNTDDEDDSKEFGNKRFGEIAATSNSFIENLCTKKRHLDDNLSKSSNNVNGLKNSQRNKSRLRKYSNILIVLLSVINILFSIDMCYNIPDYKP